MSEDVSEAIARFYVQYFDFEDEPTEMMVSASDIRTIIRDRNLLEAQLSQANAALEAADALAASMAVAISGADAPSTEVDRAREHLAAYRKARGHDAALGDAP